MNELAVAILFGALKEYHADDDKTLDHAMAVWEKIKRLEYKRATEKKKFGS